MQLKCSHRPILALLTALAALIAMGPDSSQAQAPSTKDLMVFYGWPGRGMGGCGGCFPEGDNAAHRAHEFAVYDYLILGAGLELESHPEHVIVNDMIHNPVMANTKVFGYIDAGVTTSNFTTTEIFNRALAWQQMGVEGIFLDDFGYDFFTSRARQNAIVDLIHVLGMPVIANAFDPADAFASTIDPAFNPTGVPTQLNAGDYYFYESHGIRLGEAESVAAWWSKTQLLESLRGAVGFEILSTTTKGIDDPFDYDQASFFFAWFLAVMAGHEATGYSEFNYSASGNSNASHTPRTRPSLWLGTQIAGPLLNDGSTARRQTDGGTLHVNFETVSHAFLTNTATGAPLGPAALTVQPNYPNPFNPRTTFAFTLGAAGPVQATVFDLRGRAVRRLMSTHLEAGTHQVVWDGRNDGGLPVASGSYRFVVEAGESRAERRALLLK